MLEPSYDRALAAQVCTLRDHYLEVDCGCGQRRVIALARMATDSRLATATLAHAALPISFEVCHTGPDDVYLCATVQGRIAPAVGGGRHCLGNASYAAEMPVISGSVSVE